MKQNDSALKDIGDVLIDESLSLPERRKAFLEQMGDPCRFRFQGITVSLEFSEDGRTFQDCLEEYMTSEAY